ncbi:hypothetical protein [Clostridium sporogenes]|uniref:hypothetical protein n=1 Tax=Clostridium sporogenes TaxID=1509 RepID=UPI0013D0EFA9|nr:hypothetical protein [Clostridium sporogenes]EJE7236254.1 hypothetical protein [Clostridium botulinum]
MHRYKNLLKKLKKLGVLRAVIIILIVVLTLFWYYKIINFEQAITYAIKIIRIYKKL